MTDDVADAWDRILDRLRSAVAGEFEILREIGSGGMAAVYLAREVALNRQVAIKVMSPALLTGKGMIERFKQEARTIAALDHRNIVTIYAVRGSEDLHFFVMKFVKGRSLEHIIRTAGPLPIPIVRGLLYMIGDGLGHAHRRGVIHRDVKPANILIDADGNAIVTDFGIAKVAQAESQTHSAVILGTPAYMSPEQCYGRPATAASDQYSLGLVAYEMITGRPPFTGSQFVVMESHTKVAPPPIRDVRQDCPPELERAVLRMLAKEPSERWPSVQHALAELGAATLLDGHPVRIALAKLGLPVGDEHGGAETVPRPYVSSLAILAPPDWIEAGDDLTLRASARNWSGDTMPGIAIQWRTNEPEIATVDETGTVKALAPGVVSITASFEDKESSVTVQVVPRRVATVAVSAPHEPIHVGDRVQLVARLEDKTHKELKRPIAWMTSHPNIGTISETGVFRALSPGLALAFAEADGIRGRVEIRIGPASVAMVLPTTAPTGIVVGGRVALGATVVDSLNNVLDDRVVVWTSDAPDVATITSDGMVTAVRAGEVEFTCSCEGKSATVGLRVEEPAVVTGDIVVADGEQTELSAPEVPVGGPQSSEPVAHAAERRPPEVRGRRRRRDLVVAGGTIALLVVAIAVLSQREPKAAPIPKPVSEGIVFTPPPPPAVVPKGTPATIEITPEPDSMFVGDTIQLVAVVQDSADNSLSDSVRWSSSRRSVATVDTNTGLVRARGDGTVTITALSGPAHQTTTFRVRARTRPTIATAPSPKIDDTKSNASVKKSVDPAATDAESDPTTEREFDRLIRPALWGGDTAFIRKTFQADFGDEIVSAVRGVPRGRIGVRRRGFVADPAKPRVVFMMEVYEQRPSGKDRPLIPYAKVIATVEKLADGVRLTNIRRITGPTS